MTILTAFLTVVSLAHTRGAEIAGHWWHPATRLPLDSCLVPSLPTAGRPGAALHLWINTEQSPSSAKRHPTEVDA